MKQYRNEWKFCINSLDIEILISRLSNILKLDMHSNKDGKYYIHSLYFDDCRNTCAFDNAIGFEKKFKWRIRYYENDTDNLFLEIKEKLYGRCHKEKCKISVDEYECLVTGNISNLIWSTNKSLLRRFCAEIMMYRFKPKVIIDYERIAYVQDTTNIRVTIDTNISSSYEIDGFLNGKYLCIPIQDKNYSVLEVKFDYILPGYIKGIVESYNYNQQSFSKYYLGRKKVEEVVKWVE